MKLFLEKILFFFLLFVNQTKIWTCQQVLQSYFRVKTSVLLSLSFNGPLTFCFPGAWENSSTETSAISQNKGAELFLMTFVCANNLYCFFFNKMWNETHSELHLSFRVPCCSSWEFYLNLTHVRLLTVSGLTTWSTKSSKTTTTKSFCVENNNCGRKRKKYLHRTF